MRKWSIVLTLLSLATGIYSLLSDSSIPKLLFFGSALCLYMSFLGRKRSITTKRMFVSSTGELSIKWFHEADQEQGNSRGARPFFDHISLD